MRKLLTVIVDLFFPPSHQETIVRQTLYTKAKHFRHGKFTQITYLSHYSDPEIKAAILENKFYHNNDAASFLANVVDEWIKQLDKTSVFIPIPLGKQRLRKRGHNQVETILHYCTSKPNVENNLLSRHVETVPQSQLRKEARLQNMQDVFNFNKNTLARLTGKNIILIDDVVTTGATLLAAKTLLQKQLPPETSISCLAICH